MHILHSGPVNVKSGGPALSTWLTVKGLRANGVDTDILARPIMADDKLINGDTRAIFTAKHHMGTLGYVPGIDAQLRSLRIYDLYHLQGIWMLDGAAVARYACRMGRPYIVTLRGMLYPEAIAHHSWIKRPAMALYQRNILRQAAVVQCTCEKEMEHFRNLGFKTPVALIPNPVETSGTFDSSTTPKPRFTVGYLGRIHPRKRIERIFYALDQLKDLLPSNTQAMIIGSGDQTYTRWLHNEVIRLGLSNRVSFAGFLTGKEKGIALSQLSVLVVPSDFENFGNIIPEAMAYGVPVITSTGTPWEELKTLGLGWWIDNDQESINHSLRECYLAGDNRLREMGSRGRRYILSEYAVNPLGRKMKELYDYILSPTATSSPDFLHV